MNPTELNTERLQLRPVKKSDLAAVHAMHLLPETDKYNTMGIPADIAETSAMLSGLVKENRKKNRDAYFFSVYLAASSQFIGMVALRLSAPKYKSGEIWYKFHRDFWAKGYAIESVKKLLSFGFDDLKLHRIEAGCAVDNVVSVKVMEKAGMSREGLKRLALPLKSGWSDCFEYACVNPNEQKNGAA